MRRGTVFINRARLYAYHGVLPQERTVGAWFTVSVWIDCDMQRAVDDDCLDGTVSYADVYDIVCHEMAIASNLLEHVAGRIINHIFATFSTALQVRIVIEKENPPMGANAQGAGVELIWAR